MNKPISLSRARKDRDRKDRKAKADANAVKYGRSKAEKSQHKAQVAKARRDLDGHERET